MVPVKVYITFVSGTLIRKKLLKIVLWFYFAELFGLPSKINKAAIRLILTYTSEDQTRNLENKTNAESN